MSVFKVEGARCCSLLVAADVMDAQGRRRGL